MAIGSYELAFFYDLAVSYLFTEPNVLFFPKIHHVINRYGGLIIFKVHKTVKEITDCLEKVQHKVDGTSGNHYLQFTT